MAKLLFFAILCLIVSESYVGSEGSEPLSQGQQQQLKPLTRNRRQDEVDIITRGPDGRVLNEIDIITNRGTGNEDILRGGRRTETVRRVVERQPTTVRRAGSERSTIPERRRSGVREIDIITGGRRSGVREIDIIRDGRSGVREIDIIRGGRSGAREIDIITGDRRSGVREIDIIRDGRSGVREIDIIERRTTTGRRVDSNEERHRLIPISRGGVEEGSSGIDVEKFKPMPYKFQYTAPNHKSIVERMEEADASGTVRGYYTMELGNGLYRYVDYIADKNGYRASIRSNEPGIGGGANIKLETELPPKNLKEVDLSERTDRTTTTTRTETRDTRRPSTLIEERTRTERRRGVTGVRLIPITEEERDRRERVIIEEEIIEEPRRTVVIEEEVRPATVVIEEEVREEPRRTVIVEERRTERRRSDRPRVIT